MPAAIARPQAKSRVPAKSAGRSQNNDRPSSATQPLLSVSGPELSCPCGGNCPRCRAAAGAESPVERTVATALRGDGSPLDSPTRAFMESRFGENFSGVRVHTGSSAQAAAQALEADAFASGSNVVFAQGHYAPASATGRQLIAHELAHTLQQSGGLKSFSPVAHVATSDSAAENEARSAASEIAAGQKPRAVNQRTTGLHLQPRASRPVTSTITDVDVDQKTPQSVKLTWSDGSTESDICSTGKGHCCVDDATAQGSNASVAGSQSEGSNCTPVGDFRITAKIPVTSGGVQLWSQFENARSIALHKYSPVDGTPLSHGCVRLHETMAQKIFDGSVIGRTQVHVKNLARPECDHKALINEWAGDFMTAGSQPPDGSQIDPFLGRRPTRAEIAHERHGIDEERRDLRSALGTDDTGLDTAVAATQQGTNNTAVQARIPRCVSRLTAEEARTPDAAAAGVVSATSPALTQFTRALQRTGAQRNARTLVRQAGQNLWDEATRRAQGPTADTDDRSLYWQRLQLSEAIRGWEPAWNRTHSPDVTRRAQQEMLDLLESTSRGRDTASFRNDAGMKHILISGFDPFGFAGGGDIHQGNPSGAIALALDGIQLTAGAVQARVQSTIFPVRFADFDAGAVENLFRPYLNGTDPADLIMTISMGGSSDLELETLAGRRRSSTFPDNTGRSGNPTGATPAPEIPGTGPGAEFIRTNMLSQTGNTLTPSPTLVGMRHALGRSGPLTGETEVDEIRPGATTASHSDHGPTDPASLASEGSGGGYLSNEIFYRVSNLRVQTGSSVPVIHLHTPLLAANATAAQRDQLVVTARSILEGALPTL